MNNMGIVNGIMEFLERSTSRFTGTSAGANEFEDWCAENKVKIINCGSAINSAGNLFRASTVEDIKTFIKVNKIVCIEKVVPYYYAINNFGEGVMGKT